ncbi:MAG: HAD-IA family hydrolase [Desulfobacterales bacterium]|nr:HAD-IA family hydrolase [Desulfobacterales bacterium]
MEISIDDVMDRYEILLFDAYGVLVHNSGALPGAAEVIDAFNHSGKPYYVLTNDASKLPETVSALFRERGMEIGEERIITSGSLLESYFAANNLKGKRCVALGPEESARYVELAGGRIASPGEAFDVLVVGDEAGFPFLETLDAVLTALIHKMARQEEVHLVLPNPDLIYPKTDQAFGFASGSIAGMFEKALRFQRPDLPAARFTPLGKPHAAIFEEALKRGGSRDMVMIGDQPETDIRGANAFGIDSVLMTGGVAAPKMTSIPEPMRPTYTARSLAPAGDIFS